MIDRETENKQDNYYVLVYDSIWDNPIGSNPNYLAVFLFILSHAYKKDKEIIVNNQKILVKRGQWFGSILKIANYYRLSTQTVVRILNYLKTESILEIKSTNKFTLFTVLNYDRYQPQLKADWKTNQKQIKNKSKTMETKDNVYKDNEDNKDNIYIEKEKTSKKPLHVLLVEFFNERFQTRFGSPYNWLNQDFVLMKKLTERYDEETIKKMIVRFISLDKDDWIAKQGYTVSVLFKYFSTIISSKSPFRS